MLKKTGLIFFVCIIGSFIFTTISFAGDCDCYVKKCGEDTLDESFVVFVTRGVQNHARVIECNGEIVAIKSRLKKEMSTGMYYMTRVGCVNKYEETVISEGEYSGSDVPDFPNIQKRAVDWAERNCCK